MSDNEPFFFPDPNEVRRHAKKMYTEAEYRQRYRRLDFYKPNPFQLKLHNAPANMRFINLRAANQGGKSTAAAMQLAMDMLGFYPSWYTGRKFLTAPPIMRAYDYAALIASIQSSVLRDGLARALLGDLSQPDGLGTGAIPLDAIAEKPTNSRGISDFFDTAVVNREIGGKATVQTRTYDAGRRAFQGSTFDEVFLDEDDPSLSEIFGECWARTTATNGRVILTATAIIGNTYMQQLCNEGNPDRLLIVGSLDEAEHLSEEAKRSIAEGYPEDEREARVHGGIRMGTGRVFTFNRKEIECQIDPATLEFNSAWIWGTDLPHSAGKSAHPFAGILLAHCKDNDVVYALDAFEMAASAMPLQHAERMKSALGGVVSDVRVSWPKDGTITETNTGGTLMVPYKKRGLNLLPHHSQWPDGGVSHEASVSALQQRLFNGTFKVQQHLAAFVTQLANYHRDERGQIVREGDDMVSACLCAIRSLHQARRLDETGPNSQYRGVDPVTGLPFGRGRQRGTPPWDIFTGKPI